MSLINEVEKVIAGLPLPKARFLMSLLNEYKAAQRSRQLKAYAMAARALADFKKSKGNPLSN